MRGQSRGRGRGRGGYGSRGRSQPRQRTGANAGAIGGGRDAYKQRDYGIEQRAEKPSDSVHEQEDSSDTEDDTIKPVVNTAAKSYHALLQAFAPVVENPQHSHKRKRRKLNVESAEDSDSSLQEDGDETHKGAVINGADGVDGNSQTTMSDDEERLEEAADDKDTEHADAYRSHFDPTTDEELAARITAAAAGAWKTESSTKDAMTTTLSHTSEADSASNVYAGPTTNWSHLGVKTRLRNGLQSKLNATERQIAPSLFGYKDVLYAARTLDNADNLRRLVCLHALNHVYKGRDRVLKNNERLAKSEGQDLELRDQGFTRPKVLFLLETRQACYKTVETLIDICDPAQQENKKRFQEAFSSDDRVRPDMPADYQELFDGNRDDNFKLAIKLTRKTVKYYSQFYASDIIFASPLGLRRIIENADPKKADCDFLSSIELVILDQADAMLMQNWDHVEHIFSKLNMQPRDAHGCDFSRVRSWYLDNNARHFRQTVVLSAYLTPELNRLYNTSMQNIDGKVKFAPTCPGALLGSTGLSIKQTFSRYVSSNPVDDPDERFKYFTTAIIPTISRISTSSSSENTAGILVYVPSYLDFVRVRNFLQTATVMQNISCGTLSEYDSISDARRTRSYFQSGRYSILLYSERAHHFNRYRIRGVKRVVFYALPQNPLFYSEIVGGFLGQTLEQGTCEASGMNVRAVFSKWDGLRLERVAGTERVKGMLAVKTGDTFDFL